MNDQDHLIHYYNDYDEDERQDLIGATDHAPDILKKLTRID